jgi:hypothetical protein
MLWPKSSLRCNGTEKWFKGIRVSDEFKPDNLEQGTPEYAIVEYAYGVARTIQGVRHAVGAGDAVNVKNSIVGLKYYLTRIRSVTRDITAEVKKAEQALRPPDREPGP